MKPDALVHIDNLDEKQIAQLLDAIEVKQAEVEELTVAVDTLKSEVDLFQRRYNAHISGYYLELDKVELETKEYRLRLQLRREQVSEEEIEARVESCFRASRERYRCLQGSGRIRTSTPRRQTHERQTEALAKPLSKTRQTLPSR